MLLNIPTLKEPFTKQFICNKTVRLERLEITPSLITQRRLVTAFDIRYREFDMNDNNDQETLLYVEADHSIHHSNWQ